LSPGQTADSLARKIIPLITEFGYHTDPAPSLDDFNLIPPSPANPILHFKVVRDDLPRGILFLQNQADVIFDGLSLTKTRYFQHHGYTLVTKPGFHLSFLGFHLKSPILSRLEVRRAIREALPVSLWIREKYENFVDPIPETPTGPHLESARLALDQAGYPEDQAGIRFTLRYLTTPVREGNEMALLTREALKKVGIRVEIVPLETSLFFSRLKKGEFDLFASRLTRSVQHEPVTAFFKTDGLRNYFEYSNPNLDGFVATHPDASWDELRPFVAEDLPLIPLFSWQHGVLLSKRIQPDSIRPDFIDDSFRFLKDLQIN
jgi:ABC-type transport system substrate-binding protein